MPIPVKGRLLPDSVIVLLAANLRGTGGDRRRLPKCADSPKASRFGRHAGSHAGISCGIFTAFCIRASGRKKSDSAVSCDHCKVQECQVKDSYAEQLLFKYNSALHGDFAQ